MSRSRNIKPGFFLNDKLAGLSPLTRLMFAGLWTVCDRSGRVLDRPARIKAEVLPYDDCDADKLLSQLASAGFIDRYVVDGIAVLHVIAWDKHQNPHIKEAASTLPCKCEHHASTVQAPDKEQPLPALARLIPDSGFLIPDSLVKTTPPLPSGVSPPKPKRGSRKCPDGFSVTEALVCWARTEVPSVSISTEHLKFKDHTFKTAITDWDGAWRNWMRKASEYATKSTNAEPAWRTEQRERNRAFLGPAAARKSTANTFDMENKDAAPRIVG